MYTPRADEIAAVKAILDDESFDSADSMARQILKAAVAALSRRETFIIFPQGSPHGYGMYWTQTEAERAWNREMGAHFAGEGRLLRTFPWEPKADELAACECGHGPEVHVLRGPKNKPGKPTDCGVLLRRTRDSKCPCVTYTPRKVS